MPSIFAAERWSHEDGRSWRYSGPSQTSISDAPQEVRDAAKNGWVTDKIMGLQFAINESGLVTVREADNA